MKHREELLRGAENINSSSKKPPAASDKPSSSNAK